MEKVLPIELCSFSFNFQPKVSIGSTESKGDWMPNKDLIRSTIESVYNRMDKFGDKGRRCEMQVRYSLVDPILRALGWRLENPDCVQVESPEDDTRRDYTLYVNKKAVVAIETKAFGCFHDTSKKQNPQNFPGYAQVYNYCKGKGIRVIILTDGGFWAIFRLHDNLKIKSTYTLDYDYTGATYEDNIKKMITTFSLLTPRKIANLP